MIHDKASRKATSLYKDKIMSSLYLDIVEYLPKAIVIEMEDDEYDGVVEIIEYAGHDFDLIE